MSNIAEEVAGDIIRVDVLIIGAGISGIGAAHHLSQQLPEKDFLILEAKNSYGGTWDTHRYPGARSDSDLYTFGYRFKPWVGPPVAGRSEILRYLEEAIEEGGFADRILYGHRVLTCRWSSPDSSWLVEAVRNGDDKKIVFAANFLWMCQGYYDHDKPYLPEWPAMDDFAGRIIHPQQWDPELDYTDKRVVVIGSGATAATLVPALAEKAAQVTMLQRSPTYFYCAPNKNELADRLREIGIDEPTIHRVVRAEVLHDQELLARRAVEEPEVLFDELKGAIRDYAGEDFEFDPHFVPRYRVWQQRLAYCPDGDLFQAVSSGRANVVTDEIDRFTRTGIVTKSGEELEADIVVAATGFRLLMMGKIEFEVDGRPVDWHETVNYRGMMFTGVPNLVWIMGYFRASWTLRVDLVADFVCKLLAEMDRRGMRKVEVALREEDRDMSLLPWIDGENFNPGYIVRGLAEMPVRGDKPEWMHNQDYWREREELPQIDLSGAEFIYQSGRAA
ncbi:MAG: NAD(P)/FAD-dependent oxidoreductase [Sphingopyxis sp.]|uniref:flavin-containing monooxygenase n=1 Tax=Sphingopyxis sp. TaxID=1908224 RepID=UPI0032EEE844